MLEWLGDWMVSLMTSLGYPGLALIMFLENVFPPIPSEVVLPLAGSLTLDGTFSLWAIILVGTVGSVAGAWFFYGLGRWFDEQRIRELVKKHGKWLMLKEDDLDRTMHWFQHHGEWTVFFCRMVPVVRSLISIPAGMARMDLLRFLIYTAFGTAVWNLLLALAGRLLGQGWRLVSDMAGRFQWLTLAVLITLIAIFVLSRLYQRATQR